MGSRARSHSQRQPHAEARRSKAAFFSKLLKCLVEKVVSELFSSAEFPS
jgi:hypothetical protein